MTRHTRGHERVPCGCDAAVLGGLVWLVAGVLGWGQDVNVVVYIVGLVCYLLGLMGLG